MAGGAARGNAAVAHAPRSNPRGAGGSSAVVTRSGAGGKTSNHGPSSRGATRRWPRAPGWTRRQPPAPAAWHRGARRRPASGIAGGQRRGMTTAMAGTPGPGLRWQACGPGGARGVARSAGSRRTRCRSPGAAWRVCTTEDAGAKREGALGGSSGSRSSPESILSHNHLARKYYQSAVASRPIVCQTRPTCGLIHKSREIFSVFSAGDSLGAMR